ncbi:MAG: hypothetical protein A2096_05835 [Spirochaetes bacterium GWF1_41_5]|nr:MAG: hypothetical protein A2096_05835 [Spirochaetes bacterium GWF1_41_5]
MVIASVFFLSNFPGRDRVFAEAASHTLLTADEIDFASKLQNIYNKVANLNLPAVVNISIEVVVQQQGGYFDPFGDDDIFEFFFGPRRRAPQQQKEKKQVTPAGSGFIISEDGYLISNHHVVKQANKIFVKLHNSEKEYTAEIVGTDPDLDIALLKIKEKEKFPFVKLGDSDNLNIGDIVVAIGNPFGLKSTFTTGVVSAKGRKELGINKYENYIQSDVAINPGNSGGALINVFGEVVGVNTAIISPSGGNIGIGFSIPINMVKSIIDDLKKDGKVARGYLGVGIQEVTPDIAKSFGIKAEGVLIPQVFKDSPAEKAGIKPGDIIIEYDGKFVKDTYNLRNMVAETKPGSKVNIKVLREGKEVTVTAEITKQETGSLAQATTEQVAKGAFLGVHASDITESAKRQYRLSASEGVLITGLDENSPLNDKGIQAGDVIVHMNNSKIRNLNDFLKFARENEKNKNFRLFIQRGEMVWIIAINID